MWMQQWARSKNIHVFVRTEIVLFFLSITEESTASLLWKLKVNMNFRLSEHSAILWAVKLLKNTSNIVCHSNISWSVYKIGFVF
jgi:hypothetical protein